MIRAYLDESYGPGRIVIAGFIGTSTEWEVVGDRWTLALKLRDAPYFHGSEIAAQDGAFARWERWRCDALRNACADVLAESSLGEVVAGFIGDWSEVLRQCPHIEERFPTAYAFCFELAVAQMQRAANRWYGGEDVACVFDVQDEHSEHAVRIWKARRVDELWRNIASLDYADDLKVIQLQCADMVSHENYQAPKFGAANLPLISRLHNRERVLFSGRKQWDETLIPAYWRDPELKDIFYPKEPPPMTAEEREGHYKAHDALVAKYKHLA
jgi:hypothetical protein